MFRSRAALVAILGGLALTGLFGGWFFTGHRDARARATAIVDAPLKTSAERSRTLAHELSSALGEIRAGEDARPYYEYQNLFHDPRGASSGLSVNPSPLVDKTADPLVAVHYQVDPKGTLTIPPINDEVPELNQPTRLRENEQRLAELRKNKQRLGAELVRYEEPTLVAANKPRRARRRSSTPAATETPKQQVQLDPSVYLQNANSNAVFQEAQQVQQRAAPTKRTPQAAQSPLAQRAEPQRAGPPQEGVKPAASAVDKPTSTLTSKPKPAPRRRRRARKPEPPKPPKPIEIRIASFTWRTVTIAEEPRMVATRTVDTPNGTLAQGFVVDPDRANDWLRSRTDELATLQLADRVDSVSAFSPLPIHSEWAVSIDSSAALATAKTDAARVRARFWWWFVPAALFALVVLALVVWVVYRAEKLARERSRFAAAAAHELRTPLAGLQLYGEMLADGLGDPAAAHTYAQRVSDEASRLGRVVNNVLGFTQLERGSLAVDTQPGDVAEATRRAVERSRRALESAGLEVRTEIPARAIARFDEDAHARIIGNLLDNAEKYSRESAERVVVVAVEQSQESVLVSVTDSGPGVSMKMRDRIFRPFSRNVDDDGAAGLGLGLALARTLARDQGGDLRCLESSSASLVGGARFELTLPAV